MDITHKCHGRPWGDQNLSRRLSVCAPQSAPLQVWKGSFSQNIHQSSLQAKPFPSNTSFNQLIIMTNKNCIEYSTKKKCHQVAQIKADLLASMRLYETTRLFSLFWCNLDSGVGWGKA